ncbi:hypothetical protein F2Q69_00016881 [Brassica cretica]|uniref:Uncharacterized protein n=1 Tax=Brassica cretica TaxID=69181 RepID=A0A8S9QUX4_BRACR|nr:hypothetical protein F2Q69_00016881 [Brassica cretica]
MIQDIVSQWLIILFFVNTPTSVDDCSFKLSSLQIDSSIDKKSWNKMLGKCGFSLAYILLFSDHRRCIVDSQFNLRYLPDSEITTSLVQNFVSWICYSKTGEDSSSLLRRSSELTLRLIRNGQADAVEIVVEIGVFFNISVVVAFLIRYNVGHVGYEERRRLVMPPAASSGTSISDGEQSCATWKLHYYEWAKQIFERYNISEGACQFACAALEQVDEAISFLESSENVLVPVTATLGLKKRSLTSRARKE